MLVIRPEPGASATVMRARGLGFDAISVPLFTVEAIAWTVPDLDLFDGILVTSANAMRHGSENLSSLRALPVFAVGEATAEAARDAGFDVATIGNLGADQLLEMLDPKLRLLHLCGEDRRAPKRATQEITPLIVYRSRPIEAPGLSSERRAIALVHSRRAAQRLAELVEDRKSITIAAISRDAAAGAGEGWGSVYVASRPTDDALLALAASLCNKPDPE